MKKTIALILALLTALGMLTGCGQTNGGGAEAGTAAGDSSDSPAAETVTIRVNTDGFGSGQVEFAYEGEELTFDEEYPMQSLYVNAERGQRLVIAALADEGSKLLKWTKDGADYSTEEQITVTAEADAEYLAVFGAAGITLTEVDLETVGTIGELFGRPCYASSFDEENCVYVFEQNGMVYRAIAKPTGETADAVFELDPLDEHYEAKKSELISPLKIDRIENLSESIPEPETLEQWIGKTGEELFNSGWSCNGYDLGAMQFFMWYGPYAYTVKFEGQVERFEGFNAEEDIKPMIVQYVSYEGLGDLTNLDVPLN